MKIINILSKKEGRTIWLLVMIGAVIVYHLFGYMGHYGYDDMWYAKIAHDILNRDLDLTNDHYTYRWTLVYPLAFFYKIFGIGDHTSAIYPMLATIGILVIIYKVMKDDTIPFIIASSFFILNGWTLFYSDKIMPDIILAFFIFLGFYFLYVKNFILDPNKKGISLGFLFSLAIFFAFLTKGTVVLIIPVILFAATRDTARKKNNWFWLSAFISILLLIFSYFLFLEILLGDWHSRFIAIKLNSYFNACSYNQLPSKELYKRIVYKFWKMLLYNNMTLTMVLTLPLLFGKMIKKYSSKVQFFAIISVVGLVSANFMSISYTDYIPMCPDPRHFIYLLPFFAITAAYFLSYIWESKVHIITLLIMALGVSIYLWFGLQDSYISLIAILIPLIILKYGWRIPSILMILICVLGLTFHPIRNMIVARENNYFTQKDFLIHNKIKTRAKKTIVVTNHAQSTFGNYYMEFDHSVVKFVDYDEFKEMKLDSSISYLLLLNGTTRYLSGLDYWNLPNMAKEADDKFNLVWEENDVLLFRMDFITLDEIRKSGVKP